MVYNKYSEGFSGKNYICKRKEKRLPSEIFQKMWRGQIFQSHQVQSPKSALADTLIASFIITVALARHPLRVPVLRKRIAFFVADARIEFFLLDSRIISQAFFVDFRKRRSKNNFEEIFSSDLINLNDS